MSLNVSTYLDPRFKLPSFLTDEEKQPLLEFIEAEVIDNALVTDKKEVKIQRKKQTHKQTQQRRNYEVKGNYCT